MKKEIIKLLKCEKARRDFFAFCQLMIPDFYKSDRAHLVYLCEVLQDLYEDKLTNDSGEIIKNLMINMPPRHGKSLTLQLFAQWSLGKDQLTSLMTICYNEILSGRFSKAVRNSVEADSINETLTFHDVFPDAKIKRGDGSAQLWSLEGSHFSYLGGSFGSTITGLGCRIGIIDDPIKNSKEAFNERVLDEQFSFYTDTFLSRVEEGGKQIINMTRWSDDDLCGKLLADEPDKWKVILFQAYNEETGEMLCPELMSLETYNDKKSKMSEEIFSANYQQETVNKKGSLYKEFKTYQSTVSGVSCVYIDTADKGEDSLCAVFHDVSDGFAYVTDVIHTKLDQTITEELVADAIIKNKTTEVRIESNNGGGAFCRNVERICIEKGYESAMFVSFHQSENKVARILSHQADVQRLIFYPDGWEDEFPEFAKELKKYQRAGKNKHDDAPDTITGVVENLNSSEFFVY